MKKLLLSLITLASFAAFAQKDIEVTMVAPVDAANIANGKAFPISYSIKNVGTTAIPSTDSLILGIIVGSDVIGASIINHGGMAANAVKTGTINTTLTFTAPASGVSLCILGILTFNGVAQDANTINNNDCATVELLMFPVGVAEQIALAKSIKAFPNPANTDFTITMKSSDASVSIMDITGKLVETTAVTMGEAKFDVSNYQAGIYFYQVTDASGKAVKSGKFTVSH